ncbi:MAG: nucleoside-diphosphate kinase [Sedimentisphaerales bacterium]|nr:nucleoside-diphosphate kinase [Sedimentisphaerales bacterium]
MERTLIILKPDAVQRQLMGAIISRFEQKGLQIVGAKFMQISRELAERHYAAHKGKDFFEPTVNYIISGPVLVMVLQAKGAIAIARKLMGTTFGFDAEPGTIRGDFGLSSRFNLVHGSDSPESAEAEINLYFSDEELIDYELTNRHWVFGNV